MANDDIKIGVDVDAAGALQSFRSLSTAAGAMARSIGLTDKEVNNFQSRVTGMAGKLRGFDQAMAAGAQSTRAAAGAARDYAGEIDRIARVSRTTGAAVRDATSGRFISNDEAITRTARATEVYTTAQARLAETQNRTATSALAANAASRESGALRQGELRAMRAQIEANAALGTGMFATAAASRSLGQSLLTMSSSTRYALYDVSQSLGLVGAGLLGMTGIAAKVAIDWERAFANVERTVQGTDAELSSIRTSLVGMSQEMPVAFKDLTEIATLGGQLGIASDGIVDFTRVVSMLTATTNLSADAAGTALGRFKSILGVTPDQFDNLASSILKVGVNSIATETGIVNVGLQISSMAAFAGLGADQVVGLAGALASVGAPPELSRGLVTRLFTKMSESVAEGGSGLEKFAQVTGVSSDEFKKSWGTPEFGATFLKFMQGIKSEGNQAVSTLHELGITSVRDVPLLMRLAGAADDTGRAGMLLTQTFRDAASGMNDGTEIYKQYGIIANTTASKIKVMAQNFEALFAVIGGATLGPINVLVDVITRAVKGLTDFIENGGVMAQTIIGIVLVMGTLIGILTIGGAIAARVSAAIGGLGAAMTAMGLATVGANGALSLQLGLLGGLIPAGGRAAGAISAVGAAMKLILPIGIGIFLADFASDMVGSAAVALGLKENIDGIGASLEALSGSAYKSALKDLTGADVQTKTQNTGTSGQSKTTTIDMNGAKAKAGASDSIKALTEVKNFMNDFSLGLDAGDKWLPDFTGVDDYVKKMREVDKSLAGMVESGNYAKAREGAQYLTETWTAQGVTAEQQAYYLRDYNKALQEAGPVASSTAVAYSDLEDSFTGMTEAQEASAGAFAKTASGFIDQNELIKTNQTAQQEWAKAQADAAGEGTDAWMNYYDGQSINLTNYLAGLQEQVTAQQSWETNMQLISSRVGGMLGSVPEGFLEALAELGPEAAPLIQALSTATDAELQAYVELWRQSGSDSAAALAAGMVAQQIAITNASKVLSGAALAQFLADLQAGKAPVSTILAQYGLDASGNPIFQVTAGDTDLYGDLARIQAAAQARANNNPIIYTVQYREGNAAPGPGRNTPTFSQWKGGYVGYAGGGYTGDGGKFQTAGIVHKGEFVVNKEATTRIGIGNLYAMMRGQKNLAKMQAGYASGGSVGGGFSTMDAGSIQQIVAAIRSMPIALYTSDRLIAESASRGGTQLANRGAA